ncbi:hypothetical protein BGP76_03090 [Reichenbachiella sp. MSK19-1]|nr:hypothetical protein BGP76_03090 [Reichenbachiella sp. MSK19-1]
MDNGEVKAQNIRALSRAGGTFNVTRSAFSIDNNGNASIDWVYGLPTGEVWSYPSPHLNVEGETPQPEPTKEVPAFGTALNANAAVGGGPILLKNNELITDYGPEMFQSDITTSKAPRTAIGYTADNKVIMVVVDGRQTHSKGVTLPYLAKIMKGLGCVDAMNLDGGGSSVMAANKEVINQPSDGTERKVATALMLVPGPKVIDTEDMGYIDNGATSPSLEVTPYGDSPTLWWDASTVAEAATYSFEGIVPAYYALGVWFERHESQLEEVVYDIKTSGGIETVVLDQKHGEAVAQFHALGTFYLTPDDILEIRTEGTGVTGRIALDAVKIQKRSQPLPTISLVSDQLKYATGETISIAVQAAPYASDLPLASARLWEDGVLLQEIEVEEAVQGNEALFDFSYTVTAGDFEKVPLTIEVLDEYGNTQTKEVSLTVRNLRPFVKFASTTKNEMMVDHYKNEPLLVVLDLSAASVSRPIYKFIVSKSIDSGETYAVIDEQSFSDSFLENTVNYETFISSDQKVVYLKFEVEDVVGYVGEAVLQINVLDEVLGTEEQEGAFYAYVNDRTMHLGLPGRYIYQVKLINLSGRTVLNKSRIETSRYSQLLPLSVSGVHVLKVLTSDGEYMLRKIVVL